MAVHDLFKHEELFILSLQPESHCEKKKKCKHGSVLKPWIITKLVFSTYCLHIFCISHVCSNKHNTKQIASDDNPEL